MVVQQFLDLLAKVRFLLGRQVKKQLHGVIGSIPGSFPGGGGSSPSEVCINFGSLAELVDCTSLLMKQT